MEELDEFIDQFYNKYSPENLPQGERRARLKEKLRSDFDTYTTQMYQKYASDNIPDSTRLTSLRSKYLGSNSTEQTQTVKTGWGKTLPPTEHPLIKAATSFGKSIYSGLTDTTPQVAAQTLEVAKTAINPSNIDEYIRNKKSVDFQRYVRDKDPKYSGLLGVFNPFDIDKELPRYGKQFMEDEGLGEQVSRMEQNLPQVIERRKNLEQYVQQQKQESKEKLGNVIQDYRDINNLTDFGSYIGNLAGQAAYQIPLSVATKGGSSYIMEAATVYDKQLDRLAEENNISREEVIERNLDNPAMGQAYATLAAGLDAASAGNIIGAFRKSGGSLLKKWLINAAPESITEATQGVLEDVGSGGTVEEALTGEGLAARINELAGGAVGGSVFSFIGKKREGDAANEILKAADTGDQELNAFIDSNATLTPEEEEIFKTKVAEERLAEVKNLENQLTTSEKKEPELNEEQVNEPVQPIEDSRVEDLAKRIASGEKSFTSEDLEVQANFSNEIQSRVEVFKKPEYKEAIKKVENLSQLLADPATTPELEQEYYKQLASTKQLLRQLAPPPKAKASTLKSRIEQITGLSKEKKSVQLTPKEALKSQIKILDRGIKIGRDITQEQVVSRIQEVANEVNLQPQQIRALATKAKSLSLTPESINKFNEFSQRVVEDAEYASNLSNAQTLRKGIKSASRAKSGRSFREKDLLKQFARIRPEDASDIKEYNHLASTIQEGLKSRAVPMNLSHVGGKMKSIVGKIYQQEFQAAPKESFEVEKMLSDIEGRRINERDLNRLQQVADELNIDIDEARLLEDTASDNKSERLRQTYVTLAKGKKINLDTSELTTPQQADVEAIKKIDPSLLTTEQLRLYNQVVDRINENEDFGLSGLVAAIGKAQEGWRELSKLKNETLNLTWLEQYFDSQPMAIEAIFGVPKDAALFQLYSGIKGMNEASSVSIRQGEMVAELLSNMQKKSGLGFTDESLHRQGIYQELIRTPESISPDEALQVNKELIESSIRRKRESGNEKQARIDEKFYKAFQKAKSVDEVHEIMERIDPAGKKVIEALIDFHENHRIKENGLSFLETLESDNERFENKAITKVLNYGSPRSWVKIGRGGKIEFDGINEYNPALSKAPKPKQIRSAMDLSMKDREGYVLNFNVHKNAVDNVQKLVLRAFAKQYQYQIRHFIKNEAGLQKLFGAQKDNPRSVERANNMIDALFNEKTGIYFRFEQDLMQNGRPDESKIVRFLSEVLSGLKKYGYSLTLSGYTQAPKQATVLANVARQLGTDLPILGKSIRESREEEFKDFFRGETVDVRGELAALLNVGKFFNASERLEAESKVRRFLINISNSSDKRLRRKWGGVGVLTATDVNMAKVSFLAFYMKYLKDAGVEYEGLANETQKKNDKIRQEARAYAKQRVDTLQVVSNPAEQSEFFKQKGFITDLFRLFFVPYGGFASNAKSRLFNDYKAIATGNKEQRQAGIKDFQALLIEQLTFNAISQSVKLIMYGSIGLALREAFDLDDEESWEEWWAKTNKQVKKDMAFSVVPLMLGEPGENLVVDQLNDSYYSFLQLDNPDLTKKEYEKKHAPITRYKNYNKDWWDYFGPASAPLAKIGDVNAMSKDARDKELPRKVRNLAAVTMLGQLAQLLGYLPADVSNAIKAEFYKQKGAVKERPRQSNRFRKVRPLYK